MYDQGEGHPGSAFPPGAAPLPPDGAVDKTREMLTQTKPWVRFLSIIGFISAGLMVLGGCLAGVAALAAERAELLVAGVLYPVFGLLYIVPSVFLYRYADRIADFAREGRRDQLDDALEVQKSFWKFVGIMTIVFLCIYAVAIVIVIGVAIAKA